MLRQPYILQINQLESIVSFLNLVILFLFNVMRIGYLFIGITPRELGIILGKKHGKRTGDVILKRLCQENWGSFFKGYMLRNDGDLP